MLVTTISTAATTSTTATQNTATSSTPAAVAANSTALPIKSRAQRIEEMAAKFREAARLKDENEEEARERAHLETELSSLIAERLSKFSIETLIEEVNRYRRGSGSPELKVVAAKSALPLAERQRLKATARLNAALPRDEAERLEKEKQLPVRAPLVAELSSLMMEPIRQVEGIGGINYIAFEREFSLEELRKQVELYRGSAAPTVMAPPSVASDAASAEQLPKLFSRRQRLKDAKPSTEMISTLMVPSPVVVATPAAIVSPSVTVTHEQIERTFAAMESKYAEAIANMRAEMINIMAQQVMVLRETAPQEQLPRLQQQMSEALELSARMADQRALAYFAQIRREHGQILTDVNSLDARVTEQEQSLFAVSRRLYELSAVVASLSARVAAKGELETIREALQANPKYTSALDFLNDFVGLMEAQKTACDMILDKRFVFNYGRKGLVLDAVVCVAGESRLPGLETLSFAFKKSMLFWQDRQTQSDATKFKDYVGGTYNDVHKFATSIAIAILKYSGQEIIYCSREDVKQLAKACRNAAIRFIKKHSGPGVIFAEDIAYAILSGEFMDDLDEALRARLIAIGPDERLKGTRYKPNTDIECDWLSEVLEVYGRDMALRSQFVPLTLSNADAAAGSSNDRALGLTPEGQRAFGHASFAADRSRDAAAFRTFRSAAATDVVSGRTGAARSVVS